MDRRGFHRSVLSTAGLLACSQARALSLEPPPLFPPGTTQETYFGTVVPDPYRALEDVKNPQVAAWMKAQSDYARARLDTLPERDALLARISMYDDAVAARVIQPQRLPGDLYFYERRGAKDNQFKLYVRRGLQGKEQLLVDPEALQKQTGTPHAINYFTPSFTGRYVAYGLSAGGSEDAEIFVIETATGKRVAGPISRARFGGVAWLPDDSGFFFIRLQEMKPGMAPIEKFQNTRTVLVRIGSDVEQAPVIFTHAHGVGLNPAQDSPYTFPVYGTAWAATRIYHGTDNEASLYIAPLADVLAGKAQWRRVFEQSEAVVDMAFVNERLFVLTHKNASRFKLVETSLTQPDFARAKEIVPESRGVLTGLARASDGLYVTRREGAVTQLLRVRLSPTPAVGRIDLPFQGSVAINGADYRLPGALVTLQSWTRGAQIYLAQGQRVTNTKLQPLGRYDALADYVSTEVLVRSHDGAQVPLSILHKKGLKLDGTNPTLLWGYASYGITEEPWFSAWRLAWLERGGVFAVANPRGSGAFGQDWYKAGFQATKPNTWKDFIATAEYLVAQKYTSPARLGIWGGSAGGILVGRAMTERPDLFAAVILAVGVLDTVRAELTPNGLPNIPEFGTHKTEAGFRALLAMSTYNSIRDGVRYPAVLLTHGVNDPRVEVWQSTKAAARLQAAVANVPDARPVLLRLDYTAGHGIGDTKAQRQAERADVLAFLLWQFGASK